MGSLGWDKAKRLLAEVCDDVVSNADAEKLLRQARKSDIDKSAIPDEDRQFLLRASMEIALADGMLTEEEGDAVVGVIQDLLNCSKPEAENEYRTLRAILAPGYDPKRASAFKRLGLMDAPTTAEIKAAYLKKVKEHHPDRVPKAHRDSATAKMAEINSAYDYLMGVSK